MYAACVCVCGTRMCMRYAYEDITFIVVRYDVYVKHKTANVHIEKKHPNKKKSKRTCECTHRNNTHKIKQTQNGQTQTQTKKHSYK